MEDENTQLCDKSTIEPSTTDPHTHDEFRGRRRFLVTVIRGAAENVFAVN